ncbi:MAG: hypothetical protein MR471_02490, partial [Clostridia bacterium]|nr:hypothetical protein [Clostridia bacterium]
SARERNRTAKTSSFSELSRSLVGGGAYDDPQLKNFRKQIDQQPNDVRTELYGCSLKLKLFANQFFNK